MSEICITSSKAATRGSTFLHRAVDGATRGGSWRQPLFAAFRRRRDKRIIGGHQRHDQRRHFFRQLVGVLNALSKQNLGDAGQFSSGFGSRAATLADDENVDIAAERRRGGQRFCGQGIQGVFS
jgi:hypothetical protein